MTAKEKDRLRQLEALFDAVLDHAAGPEREAWLDRLDHSGRGVGE